MNTTHDTRDSFTADGDFDARAALAAAEGTQASVADRLITPWWYHPVLGLMEAALFAVIALDVPVVVMLPVVIAAVVTFGVLVGSYRKITGVWVDWASAGPRARALWVVFGVPIVVLLVVGLIWSGQIAWPLVLVGAVLIVAWVIVVGRALDAAMRAEIRSGQAVGKQVR